MYDEPTTTAGDYDTRPLIILTKAESWLVRTARKPWVVLLYTFGWGTLLGWGGWKLYSLF